MNLEFLLDAMSGTPHPIELDELHVRLKHAVDTKAGFAAIEAIFQECLRRPESDGECLQCGVVICPHHEPLHYHHDGCPACS